MSDPISIPDDLQDELATLAELFPVGKPLSYDKARLLVHAWRQISDEALSWAGAEMDIRIDPDPYRFAPELYGVPAEIDYSVDLWQGFPDNWRQAVPTTTDLVDMVTYLRLFVITWGASPVARRRHARKDRLDGFALGLLVHPENSTVSIYLQGSRSILEIVNADLRDQIK
ncbi:hypothetical protein [Acidithiobacillus sulfuriphilus]|uniref:hypothetical protein n=1 Tax=Acidithiobacillus sulfuriphilus TaxID=1867749 RepID=UPI003F5E530C